MNEKPEKALFKASLKGRNKRQRKQNQEAPLTKYYIDGVGEVSRPYREFGYAEKERDPVQILEGMEENNPKGNGNGPKGQARKGELEPPTPPGGH